MTYQEQITLLEAISAQIPGCEYTPGQDTVSLIIPRKGRVSFQSKGEKGWEVTVFNEIMKKLHSEYGADISVILQNFEKYTSFFEKSS